MVDPSQKHASDDAPFKQWNELNRVVSERRLLLRRLSSDTGYLYRVDVGDVYYFGFGPTQDQAAERLLSLLSKGTS